VLRAGFVALRSAIRCCAAPTTVVGHSNRDRVLPLFLDRRDDSETLISLLQCAACSSPPCSIATVDRRKGCLTAKPRLDPLFVSTVSCDNFFHAVEVSERMKSIEQDNESTSFETQTVLVVDDYRDAANSFGELLRELGSARMICYDAHDALSTMRRLRQTIHYLCRPRHARHGRIPVRAGRAFASEHRYFVPDRFDQME
jgi:hypothetical protein